MLYVISDMLEVSKEEFESFVREGVDAIPVKFRSLIKNVGFLVDNEPTAEQRRQNQLRPGETLLGLYEGIPRPARGAEYGGLVMPDRITIFKKPIEAEGDTGEEIRKLVIDTVWHEVAHHFGLDEREVRKREGHRKKE